MIDAAANAGDLKALDVLVDLFDELGTMWITEDSDQFDPPIGR